MPVLPRPRRRVAARAAVAAALAGAVLGGVVLAAGSARAAAPASLRASQPTQLAAGLYPAQRLGAVAVSTARPETPRSPGSPRPTAVPTAAVTAAPQAASGGCGFFNVACQIGHAIDSWFADLVKTAVNPMFALLGESLLSTPQVGGIGTVRSLWSGSLAIADTSYVLLVVVGGITLMSYQTLQTSYAVKDIAPRLVVGFIAANLSLLLAGKAIQFADGISAALAGQGLDPHAAGQILRNVIYRVVAEGSIFFILLAVFAVVLVVVLTVIYVARLMLTVLLIAMAPLALACHALPQTEGVARWWWRAFAGVLAIQAAQALVLVAAARIFFATGWATLIGGALGGHAAAVALDAIQMICVLYILIRIPFWIGRHVWHGRGRSPIRSAARFVFAAAVLRRVAPVLSGRGGGAGRRPPGGGGSRRGNLPPTPSGGPRGGGGSGGAGPGSTGPAGTARRGSGGAAGGPGATSAAGGRQQPGQGSGSGGVGRSPHTGQGLGNPQSRRPSGSACAAATASGRTPPPGPGTTRTRPNTSGRPVSPPGPRSAGPASGAARRGGPPAPPARRPRQQPGSGPKPGNAAGRRTPPGGTSR